MSILVVCCLVLPLIFLLNLSHEVRQFLGTLSFALCAVICLITFFGPKIVQLVFQVDLTKKSLVDAMGVRLSGSGKGVKPEEKVHPDQDPRISNEEALRNLKKMPPGERVEFISRQVDQWRGMLLKVNELGSSGVGSSAGSQEKGPSLISRVSHAAMVSVASEHAIEAWNSRDDLHIEEDGPDHVKEFPFSLA